MPSAFKKLEKKKILIELLLPLVPLPQICKFETYKLIKLKFELRI